VGSDLTIRDLKEFITAETAIPAAAQSLTVNGRALSQDTETLRAAGIQDDDMLAVTARQPQQPQRTSRSGGTAPAAASENAQIEAARQQILSQPQAVEQLRQQQPELINALNDPARFREVFMASRRAQDAQVRQEQQRLARLDDDVNEENQEEIYKRIQQQNIELEYERVMEENPECELW
jgi:DNA damage-inducible protein 1